MKHIPVWIALFLGSAAILKADPYTLVYTDWFNTPNDGNTLIDSIFPLGTDPSQATPLPSPTQFEVIATFDTSNPDTTHGANLATGLQVFTPTSAQLLVFTASGTLTYTFVQNYVSPYHMNPGENPSDLNVTDVAIFDQSNIFIPGHFGIGLIEDPWIDGSGFIGDFQSSTNASFTAANIQSATFTNYRGTGFSPGPGDPLLCDIPVNGVAVPCGGYFREPIMLLGSDGVYYWLWLKHGDTYGTYPATATINFTPRAMNGAHFTGTSRDDYTIWRPSTGEWYLLATNGSGVITNQWGQPGDIPVPGDYDGDGIPDYAIWRPSTGTWYVILSSGGVIVQQWGLPGDIPTPGDYDGDGKTDLAIWRPSEGNWYVIPSSTGVAYVQQWGLTGDVPVPADYDGDHITDLAVWRPSEGNWYIIPSSTGAAYVQLWGLAGDIPVPADYDGDHKADLAIWRPSEGNWWILSSSTGAAHVQQWGLAGDIPAPADYDGDGKADTAIWRPTTGTWYVLPSGSPGTAWVQQWGQPGDVP